MSRLYASIDSDTRKAQVTSRGHKHISTHTRGWDSGVLVVADTTGDGDVFRVYATGGSNGVGSNRLIGTVIRGTFSLYEH